MKDFPKLNSLSGNSRNILENSHITTVSTEVLTTHWVVRNVQIILDYNQNLFTKYSWKYTQTEAQWKNTFSGPIYEIDHENSHFLVLSTQLPWMFYPPLPNELWGTFSTTVCSHSWIRVQWERLFNVISHSSFTRCFP